jgi:2-desacetyl-2-hydroxyethyl bacteriochlorophyllide A dehydrogenase
MKTVVLEKPGSFVLTETQPPQRAGAGEALVRVHRIGVCGTDLHAFRGRQPFFTYPRILGHELGIEVLEVGPGVTEVTPGDRCAVEPYINCGSCIACRRGRPNCCATLKVLGVHTDGGMRERIVVPSRKLHPSRILSLEQLALVETLGIGSHAVNRAAPEAGEFVLVIGAGPIGLAVVQFAKLADAHVIVLDTNARRLAFCKEQYGVPHVVNAAEAPLETIKELTRGDLPTVVFDATGNSASMRGALQYVAQGGRLVFVGLTLDEVGYPHPEFHRRETTLLSSRNSTPDDFRRIIALIESGRLDTSPWITHRAELADVPERFPGWLAPEAGVIKAVIEVR